MPTLRSTIERELLDLSRTAIQLEKLTGCTDLVPGPVRYQQILRRLSELHFKWQQHRLHSSIVPEWDEPSLQLEQQLKAASISDWPRSADAGLSSLRVAVPRILQQLYQQIAKERMAHRTFVHSRKASPARRSALARAESPLQFNQISA